MLPSCFILALVRVLYADDNAIFRQKLLTKAVRQVAPLLAEIIRQGIQEDVLTTPYPEQIGEVIVSLVLSLSDTIAWQLLSPEQERDALLRAEYTVAAYTNALERILGAPAGSLPLLETETLKEWFASPNDL